MSEWGSERVGEWGIRMTEWIKSYKELRVYQSAMDVAMEIVEVTKTFPTEERYSSVS